MEFRDTQNQTSTEGKKNMIKRSVQKKKNEIAKSINLIKFLFYVLIFHFFFTPCVCASLIFVLLCLIKCIWYSSSILFVDSKIPLSNEAIYLLQTHHTFHFGCGFCSL